MDRVWKGLIVVCLVGMCLLFYLILDETWSIVSTQGEIMFEHGQVLTHAQSQIEHLEWRVEELEFEMRELQDILE